jgi:hypothetical protein
VRALRRFSAFALLVAACSGGDPNSNDGSPEHVVVAPEELGLIHFEQLTPSRVEGSYEYRDLTLEFESEALDTGAFVTIALRGMVLVATLDPSGVFDLDGFDVQTGDDTQMTRPDVALIRAFEVALTDLYRERAAELPALDKLNRVLTVWGDYSETFPLSRVFYGRNQRIVNEDVCDMVNKPQQTGGYRWIRASHDCLVIKNVFSGDCNALTGGCVHGDDSSTVDRVFMSMHPSGSCGDGTFFGTNESSFRCFEPDHDPNIELSYGGCFGRCGGECGGATQFTGACLDHDECVRFGHALVNPQCDDDFVEAAIDAVVASNCAGVAFTVDWNNAGSSAEGNCPWEWKDSNDGCDAGCQFIDGDCFR